MRLLSLALLALLSHWRRHRVQFFSIFTGLWLATALWTGVQALNSQARSDYARASAVLAGPLEAFRDPKKLGDDATVIRNVETMRAAITTAARSLPAGDLPQAVD